MKNLEKTSWMATGLLLPGCMFIGMGIGMLFNAIPVGLFIGMGFGFISIGILKVLKGNESNQQH